MKKDEIVELFKWAEKPLSKELLDSIEEGLEYYVFSSLCRICGHVEIKIAPSVCDLENLECANCNNMSTQPITLDEELESWDEIGSGFFIQ